VIVIDDGSSDKTYNTARSKADIVLRNHRNLGKGNSIRKGIITLINDVDFDYVITMDADNQHSVSDIDGFLKEAEKGTDFVIGNSSSGLAEVPSFKIAAINIGDRQKGRIKAASVIDCLPSENAIKEAIRSAYSKEFQETLKQVENPYGTGNASSQIIDVIKRIQLTNILKKSFYDVEVKV
jgi:UDP-N-acetylglucosamine 2-epimerase